MMKKTLQLHRWVQQTADSSPPTLVSCRLFDFLSTTIDSKIDNSADEIDVHNGDLAVTTTKVICRNKILT